MTSSFQNKPKYQFCTLPRAVTLYYDMLGGCVRIKCGAMDWCGLFGHSETRGHAAQDLVVESHDQRNNSSVGLWTMLGFFMAFGTTKAGSSLLWWIFEEIPVAHTGFPIHIPKGFLKGIQSASSKVSKKNSMSSSSNCLPQRYTEACSPFLKHSWRKTKQLNGPRSDSFHLQRILQWQWKPLHLQSLCGGRA